MTAARTRVASASLAGGPCSASATAASKVPAHLRPKAGQELAEADQALELRLLLGGPVVRVVEVLLAACPIDAGRLQLRAGARRDPDVLPGGRDDERAYPVQPLVVRDRC